MKKSCKTCKWFDVENAKSEGGRIMSNRIAKCLFTIEWDQIKIPDSHRDFMGLVAAAKRKSSDLFTCANYGEDCPCYEKRNHKS